MSEPHIKVESATKKNFKQFMDELSLPAISDFKRVIPVSSIRHEGLVLIGYLDLSEIEDIMEIIDDVESSKCYISTN